MMPFFVHAYVQPCLVLKTLVFQKSSRVLGGRFSSMYIGVVLFVSSFMILLMVRSLSVRFLKAIFFSVVDDVWWCFFHVVVF